jgi:hypothetical protein
VDAAIERRFPMPIIERIAGNCKGLPYDAITTMSDIASSDQDD